jgi:hypothetical protein
LLEHLLSESPETGRLSQGDVAEYIASMADELSAMAEGARLDGLATILYAARLEANRALQRLKPEPPRSLKHG